MRISKDRHPNPCACRQQPRFVRVFPSLMITACAMALLFAAHAARVSAQAKAAKHLLIYSIDVEGGQSTLLVGPTGESMLIDTGWPDAGGRDADRIQQAMRDAGIARID